MKKDLISDIKISVLFKGLYLNTKTIEPQKHYFIPFEEFTKSNVLKIFKEKFPEYKYDQIEKVNNCYYIIGAIKGGVLFFVNIRLVC